MADDKIAHQVSDCSTPIERFTRQKIIVTYRIPTCAKKTHSDLGIFFPTIFQTWLSEVGDIDTGVGGMSD